MMTKTSKIFDSRVVDRYIAKGLIKESEYKDHLKKLPDDGPNANWIPLDLEEAGISDTDEDEHNNLDKASEEALEK